MLVVSYNIAKYKQNHSNRKKNEKRTSKRSVNRGCLAGRLALLGLPVALQLPSVLVIGPIVHELARAAEAAIARFFVVLAYVGLVVPAHSCSQVL